MKNDDGRDDRTDTNETGADELSALARELPVSIEPARDLWPGVEARIQDLSPVKGHIEPDTDPVHGRRRGKDERKSDRRSRRTTPDRSGWPWKGALGLALAAGLAGVVAGGLLFDAPIPGGTGNSGVTTTLPVDRDPYLAVPAAHPQIRELEDAYEPDIRILRLLVESSELAPETREVLDESLSTIDRAIAEARQALEEDPGAPRAIDGLRRMYDAKVDLLRFVATQSRT